MRYVPSYTAVAMPNSTLSSASRLLALKASTDVHCALLTVDDIAAHPLSVPSVASSAVVPAEPVACLLTAALAATGNTSTPHRLTAAPDSRLSVKYRPLPLHTCCHVQSGAQPDVQQSPSSGFVNLHTARHPELVCYCTWQTGSSCGNE